jgi:hypothetical protein
VTAGLKLKDRKLALPVIAMKLNKYEIKKTPGNLRRPPGV